MTDYLEAVKQAGVVGAGGAGFPTWKKLEAKVDIYIANGAECEPLLQKDKELMSRCASEVVRGLETGMESTGAKKGFIAVKAKYERAVSALRKELQNGRGHDIELFLLDNYYPAGDEHVLVYEVSGRLVPEGGIPLQRQVVVNNVATLINVARAISGIPVTSVWLTVAGAVDQPQTVEVPVGTSIGDLLDFSGGPNVEGPYALIRGGPMMGSVATDPSAPITKVDGGIIVLPRDHLLVRMKTAQVSLRSYKARSLCIRCNLCTDVCPRYLLGHNLQPARIMRAVAWGLESDAEALASAFLCTECGACTFYGCPMTLDPCAINHAIKEQLTAEGFENPHRSSEIVPHEYRNLRKIPTPRLIGRLGLIAYDRPAPMKDQPIVPRVVRIPLKQHIGAPAVPVVSVGDFVEKGTPIGEIPSGSLGARIHASISGKVAKIDDAIVIEA